MELMFENSAGKIRFFGHSMGVYRIIGISGLSVMKKEADTVVYPFFDGGFITKEYMPSRTVTMSFDVVSSDVRRDISKAAEVLSKGEGVLKIKGGHKKRICSAVCTSFYEDERHGKGISRCYAQFMCPDPYFYDDTLTSVPLFKRSSVLKSTFTLPCTLSERINSMAVKNSCIYDIYPIYRIYNVNHASKNALDLSEDGVKIMNLTTGKSITLLHTLKDGEVIEIDVKNASVTSSVSGNILNSMSDDSSLTDMKLTPGENIITADSLGEAPSLSVVCEYRNKYAEAVC